MVVDAAKCLKKGHTQTASVRSISIPFSRRLFSGLKCTVVPEVRNSTLVQTVHGAASTFRSCCMTFPQKGHAAFVAWPRVQRAPIYAIPQLSFPADIISATSVVPLCYTHTFSVKSLTSFVRVQIMAPYCIFTQTFSLHC